MDQHNSFWGNLSAFLALTLDNVGNLVFLSSILIFTFHYPADLVLFRMIPGTAFGVLFGDIIYTWLAVRLNRRTGRNDVTAMPLGLDTPSTIGIAYAVLGPAYLATKIFRRRHLRCNSHFPDSASDFSQHCLKH